MLSKSTKEAKESINGVHPSTYLVNNKEKKIGAIVFKDQDEYNNYVNGFAEHSRINHEKSLWENKVIVLK